MLRGLAKIAVNINPEIDKAIKERLEWRAKVMPGVPAENRTQAMKNTSFVSPNRAHRYKTVGNMKRFWSGKGGFNSKWGNRASLLAGLLGATGLGIRGYNELKTGSSNPYVHDSAFVPPPVKQPRVPTPGPSTKPIDLDSGLGAASKGFSSDAGKAPTPSSTKSASESTDFLLAGGLGGAGGWLLGKKLVEPLIAEKERRLKAALQNLKQTKKYAPIGAAAAGAIILAALSGMRKKQERKSSGILDPQVLHNQMQAQKQQIDPRYALYDLTNSGFVPNDLRSLENMY